MSSYHCYFTVYLQCTDVETRELLSHYTDVIATLTNASAVIVQTTVEKPPPEGCAVMTVSTKCEVHMLLKGLIDVGKEVSRLEDKSEKLKSQLDKLQKAKAMPDYSSKVPVAVQLQNEEKVRFVVLFLFFEMVA